MNWVECEMAELRRAYFKDPDAWLLIESVGPQCEHRWNVKPTFIPAHMRGSFNLPLRTTCTKCGAEA